MIPTLQWLDHHVPIPEGDRLDELIEFVVADVIARSPEIVTIERSGSDMLSIGTREGRALVVRDPLSGEPPYCHAIEGDEPEVEDWEAPELEFRVASGEPLPVPETWLLDERIALDVVRDYIRSGTFSARVRWQEV